MTATEYALPPLTLANPVSRVHWLLLGALHIALGCTAFAVSLWVDNIGWNAHGWWCAAALLACVPTLAHGLRAGVGLFMVDHRYVFLAAYLAYFCFGAALPAWGAEESVLEALSFYPVLPKDAMWVNGLNGCGMGIALITATLLNFPRTAVLTGAVASRFSRIPIGPVLIGIMVVGMFASNYVLAIDLGVIESTPSVFVRFAPRLTWVAILLATAIRSRDSAVLKVLAGFTAVMLALVGLLQFNKSECLLPLCAFVMGMAWSRQSIRYLVGGISLMVFLFSLLGDVTATGRHLLSQIDARTLQSRLAVLTLSQKLVAQGEIDQRYVGWARFCYIAPQVGAVDLYQAGQGGDGFDRLPWVFVPRVLNSSKPEMTRSGRDFTEKINGNNLSSTGTGIFTSGYYHGGFWGWMFAAFIAGFSIRFLSVVSAKIFEIGALVLSAIPLLGVLSAFRIDGDIITDHFSTTVIVGYALLAGWLYLVFQRSQPFSPEADITRLPR